jgi:hypothetical protein
MLLERWTIRHRPAAIPKKLRHQYANIAPQKHPQRHPATAGIDIAIETTAPESSTTVRATRLASFIWFLLEGTLKPIASTSSNPKGK